MIRVGKTLVVRRFLSQGNLRNLKSYAPLNKASASPSTVGDVMPESDTHFMLILGKPGGGKGTISKKILKDFDNFNHFSTGDMLRQHVREKTPIGNEAKKHMDSGRLVPDDLIIELVLDEAHKEAGKGNSMLLDGFPRNIAQAQALDKCVNVDLVVNLDIPNETIVERIADRWIHPASSRIYNYSYNPPKVHGKDDITGEDLIQREDDKPETVLKRLKSYEAVTAPLVDYYMKKGVLQTFSGTESDVIYPMVNKWINAQIERNNRVQ